MGTNEKIGSKYNCKFVSGYAWRFKRTNVKSLCRVTEDINIGVGVHQKSLFVHCGNRWKYERNTGRGTMVYNVC